MIADQLLNQFNLLLKAVAPPLIRVTDSPERTTADPHWAPGEKLPATVLSNLPNGRFQVQVDNQLLELNLPKNTQPGEQLELVYISNTPRLTFTMAASPALPASPGLSGSTELSETAHLLGQLAQQGRVTAQGVQAQLPVLATPPADPGRLAGALAQALGASGLFYESHQAQWVQGERPLTALLQEPQAQAGQGPAAQPGQGLPAAFTVLAQDQPPLASPPAQDQPPLAPPPSPAQGEPPLASSPPPAQGQLPQVSPPSPAQAQTPVASPGLPADPAAAADRNPGAPPLLAGMEPANAALLQQQLQILNTGMIQWSGPVWPGQQMDWEISGLPAGQVGEEQQWQTKVTLTLPHLGEVSAWLILGRQGVQVRLQTDQAQTRQLLAVSGTLLDNALQSAGLNLTHFSVDAHG